MYILYLFEAVYIAHDISFEKKGLECVYTVRYNLDVKVSTSGKALLENAFILLCIMYTARRTQAKVAWAQEMTRKMGK